MEVYRKPTHTGQYLNFHCRLEHKDAVGLALFRRVKNHTINLVIQCAEEQKIIEELQANRYPSRRITMIKKKA